MNFLFGKFNYSSKTRFVNVPAIGEAEAHWRRFALQV
jgi:hypothetical protein